MTAATRDALSRFRLKEAERFLQHAYELATTAHEQSAQALFKKWPQHLSGYCANNGIALFYDREGIAILDDQPDQLTCAPRNVVRALALWRRTYDGKFNELFHHRYRTMRLRRDDQQRMIIDRDWDSP